MVYKTMLWGHYSARPLYVSNENYCYKKGEKCLTKSIRNSIKNFGSSETLAKIGEAEFLDNRRLFTSCSFRSTGTAVLLYVVYGFMRYSKYEIFWEVIALYFSKGHKKIVQCSISAPISFSIYPIHLNNVYRCLWTTTLHWQTNAGVLSSPYRQLLRGRGHYRTTNYVSWHLLISFLGVYISSGDFFQCCFV